MISSQTFIQAAPSMAWTINHSFNGAPICDVLVTEGGVTRKMLPLSVKHVSNTQLLIEFSEPTAGMARLVGKYIGGWVGGAGSVDLGQYYVPVAPIDSSVVMLLHGDGADGSTNVTDSSSFARTMTASGVTISTANSRFGTGSFHFQNGSITTPHTEEMAFGTGTGGNGDFTLEVQWKPDTLDGSQNIINVAGYNTGILWRSVAGVVDVFLSGEQMAFGTGPCFTAGVWQHAALVRYNGQVGMFLNGIQQGSWVANNINLSAGSQTVWVGRAAHTATEPLTGYLAEVRICRTAKYTGNFTPPSARFA